MRLSLNTEGDRRYEELGLSPREAHFVLSLCRPFVNYRDQLEDVQQTALAALWDAFSRKERENDPIRNRMGFIYGVVRKALGHRFVRANKGELLYHCTARLFEDPKTYHGHLVYDEYPEERGSDAEESLLGEGMTEEEKVHLWHTIEMALTPEDRCIFLAYYLEGLKQKELALRFHTTQPLISQRLANARALLREALASSSLDCP